MLKYSVTLSEPISRDQIASKIIRQDIFDALPYLPDTFVDLMIIDPPYNLNKKYGESAFSRTDAVSYESWVESWLRQLIRVLKPTASVYVCCDWTSSNSIHGVLAKYFKVRNRITWEREKGRGALRNWKNCSEDIWFCTVADEYKFDVDAVKLKRRVIAPYRTEDGKPKDWEESSSGNYRLTHPSNLWTDISIPFWSMPENTDHPTQKPEKLIAKLILASSKPGDLIFDPFLGSGTTAVVAKKLNRQFAGVEVETEYCMLTAKRLRMAEKERTIQGYHDGCFWERNSLSDQRQTVLPSEIEDLFDGK